MDFDKVGNNFYFKKKKSGIKKVWTTFSIPDKIFSKIDRLM